MKTIVLISLSEFLSACLIFTICTKMFNSQNCTLLAADRFPITIGRHDQIITLQTDFFLLKGAISGKVDDAKTLFQSSQWV